MFVKINKNREGNQYVYIVEGYRDGGKVKHRTIQSLGKLSDLEAGNPNFLKELKAEVKAGKYQPTEETLSVKFDLSQPISNPLKNYGWLLTDRFYEKLGISSVIRAYQKNKKQK